MTENSAKSGSGQRTAYYDHEIVYRRNAEKGLLGWSEKFDVMLFDELIAANHRPLPCRMIDIGCGGGLGAIYFAGYGFSAVGVDFSETAVRMSRKNAVDEPGAVFVAGDALRLPFAASQFEFALSKLVLHCLIGDDRAQFLSETRRVLTPGGLMFLTSIAGLPHDEKIRAKVDPSARVDSRGVRCFRDADEILTEITTAGFDILRTACKAHKMADVLVVHARKTGSDQSGRSRRS